MAEIGEHREARARLALGLLLYEVNKDECAAEVLRAGLSYAPDLVEAHVWLGFVYGRMTSYEEMIGSFREALRLDPQAVRAAVGAEPEQVRQIRLILHPLPESTAPAGKAPNPAIPPEIKEAWELAEAASDYVRAGRDAEAVEALEKSLSLDPTWPHATALLCLVYLLNREQNAAWADRSVLRKISPWLSRLIFRL